MISTETRAESYKTVDVETKKKQVLECLGDREMTAKEVAKEMLRRVIQTSKKEMHQHRD